MITMYALKIKLSHKKHPYQHEAGSYLEAWGSISIEIHDVSGFKVLRQIDWDVLNLAEWFVDHKKAIESDEFIVLGEKTMPNESLSQAMYRIRLQYFLEPDDMTDDQFHLLSAEYEDYYERHSLLTEMRGSGMPEILIGLNGSMGEISLLNKKENWKYQFDMKTFISEFSQEIENFISKWLEETQNVDSQKRGSVILSRL